MDGDEHIYDTIPSESNGKAKKEKKEKKEKKHCDVAFVADLQRQIDELKGQLSLKYEILEKTDKKNARLFDENRQLKFDMRVLEMEKEDVVQRLKVEGFRKADTQLLSPGIRSSWIGERWESLYKHEWTAAYEELCCREADRKSHMELEKQLMTKIEWCFSKCSALAKYQMEKIHPLLQNLACHLHLKEPLEINNIKKTGSMTNTLDSLRKSVHHCQHDIELLDIVKETCVEDYKTDHKNINKTELKFVSKCMELCWLMQISDPQLTIEYKNLDGTPFDSSKFNQYSIVQHNTVDFVVWPALVMVDNKQVVSKGIVRTVSDMESTDIVKSNHSGEHTQGDTNKQNTKQHATRSNDYMTMRMPTPVGSPNNNFESRGSIRNERVNPFDRDNKSNSHLVSHETEKDYFQSSNNSGNITKISEEDRKHDTHYFAEKNKHDYSRLSKSAGRSSLFRGSAENLLKTAKTKVVMRKKKKKPKEGEFVSYLARSSSTL